MADQRSPASSVPSDPTGQQPPASSASSGSIYQEPSAGSASSNPIDQQLPTSSASSEPVKVPSPTVDLDEIPAYRMSWNTPDPPVFVEHDATTESPQFGSERYEQRILGSSLTALMSFPTGRKTDKSGDGAEDLPPTPKIYKTTADGVLNAMLLFHCCLCLASLGKSAAAFTFVKVDNNDIEEYKRTEKLQPQPERDVDGKAQDVHMIELAMEKINGSFTVWERYIEPRINYIWTLADTGIYTCPNAKCPADRLLFVKYVKHREIPADAKWIEDSPGSSKIEGSPEDAKKEGSRSPELLFKMDDEEELQHTLPD
ncbi:hypothetical protein TWF696_003837 [Orbilia brochopaga]|uniref:Uncharacterized protein n=1 Tax=Orbilia brochopaga TaxID=3140254 RepID=A0AAV9V602_9PEZI